MACASASCASTCAGRCWRRPTRRASGSSSARSPTCARSARRSSILAPRESCSRACIARYAPELLNSAFARQYRQLFPGRTRRRRRRGDQIATLLELQADPSRVPAELSLRTLNAGGFGAAGEDKYMINRYLRERGDANIKTNADLIAKARFYQDPNFPDRKQAREQAERATVLDTSARLQGRFAVQTMLLQCMQEQRLDALVSPMSTVPPRKLTSPREPAVQRPHADRLVADRSAGISGDHRAGRIHDDRLGSRRRRRAARVWSARCRRRFPSASISSRGRSTSRCCSASPRPTKPRRSIAGHRPISVRCRSGERPPRVTANAGRCITGWGSGCGSRKRRSRSYKSQRAPERRRFTQRRVASWTTSS